MVGGLEGGGVGWVFDGGGGVLECGGSGDWCGGETGGVDDDGD